MIVNQPLELTSTKGTFDVFVNVAVAASRAASAIRTGLRAALIAANPDNRPPLKKAGYVTRDPREVERKKYGRQQGTQASAVFQTIEIRVFGIGLLRCLGRDGAQQPNP